MDKYKKVNISVRLTADRVEQIRLLATEENILVTEVMQRIVDHFFDHINDPAEPAAPQTEPAPQKECIVLTDMQLQTVAAIMECSDILKLSYPQTLDKLMEKIIEQAGAVTPTYINKAKELFNKNI